MFAEAKNLGLCFGEHWALLRVGFELEPGSLWALCGQNGAGKSCLCRILALLQKPEEGEWLIDGQNAHQNRSDLSRRIGYLAEKPLCYAELSAEENLLFLAHLYGLKDPLEKTRAVLERFGLKKESRVSLKTMSRGQLQRLSLARAFLHDPELLILDEPSTALDFEGQALLQAALLEHQKSGGIAVVASHDLQSLSPLVNGAIFLKKGRVLFAGKIGQGSLSALYREHSGVQHEV